jgi:hypothetical protein
MQLKKTYLLICKTYLRNIYMRFYGKILSIITEQFDKENPCGSFRRCDLGSRQPWSVTVASLHGEEEAIYMTLENIKILLSKMGVL